MGTAQDDGGEAQDLEEKAAVFRNSRKLTGRGASSVTGFSLLAGMNVRRNACRRWCTAASDSKAGVMGNLPG